MEFDEARRPLPELCGKLYKLHSHISAGASLSGLLGKRYYEADDALSVLYCFKSAEEMRRRTPQYCFSFGAMKLKRVEKNDGRLSARKDKGWRNWLAVHLFEIEVNGGKRTLTVGCPEQAETERWMSALQQRIDIATSSRINFFVDSAREVADGDSTVHEVTVHRMPKGSFGIVFEANKMGDPAVVKLKVHAPKLRVDDVVLGVNDVSLDGERGVEGVLRVVDELRKVCPDHPDTAVLKVRRPPDVNHEQVQRSLGITLLNLAWSPIGVEIVNVANGSLAHEHGMRPGHALVAVNGEACLSSRHAYAMLSEVVTKGDAPTLIVSREPPHAPWPEGASGRNEYHNEPALLSSSSSSLKQTAGFPKAPMVQGTGTTGRPTHDYDDYYPPRAPPRREASPSREAPRESSSRDASPRWHGSPGSREVSPRSRRAKVAPPSSSREAPREVRPPSASRDAPRDVRPPSASREPRDVPRDAPRESSSRRKARRETPMEAPVEEFVEAFDEDGVFEIH